MNAREKYNNFLKAGQVDGSAFSRHNFLFLQVWLGMVENADQ